MVNNSTNINKTNDHLSSQLIEHRKTTIFDVGNPGTGLGQVQKGGADKPVNAIGLNVVFVSESKRVFFSKLIKGE